MKIRKWLRIIHRDMGYIFFGMSLVYGISGIALNHLDDWNPDYIIRISKAKLQDIPAAEDISKEVAGSMARQIDQNYHYRSHFFPRSGVLKIFIKQGSVTVNLDSGQAYIEVIKKRPVFREMNFLHYNKPKKLFTWFSDAFALALILLAISGLFLIRGKKGITGRGAWLTALGILIPAIFLILYL
jgi:hypothetical protein